MKRQYITRYSRRALAAAVMAVAFEAAGQVSVSPQRFSPLPGGYLERAAVMSEEGNYGGSIDQLRFLITQGTALGKDEAAKAVYLLAHAYYERGDEECVSLLEDFAALYPASRYALQADLLTADFYFFARMYPQALTRYDDIDFARLNRTDSALYAYRRALSMLMCGYIGEAAPLFKGLESYPEYTQASIFYLAYIDYMQGDLAKAKEGFLKVGGGDSDGSKAKVTRRRVEYVPTGLEAGYYLAQIDYADGKYREVTENGRSLVQKQPVKELLPDLYRAMGLSYFKLGDNEIAGQYLNRYFEDTKSTPKADAIYAAGVIDYSEGRYDEARERMSRLTDLNDELSQSAWLYLGQLAVKEGDITEAALAFEKASKMNFDPRVKESALYNYAAAVTRGGNVPFSSAGPMLEEFVKNYPGSEFAPKVEEYLATAYYNDRNYVKALESITKIQRPSGAVLDAKQKICYELGVESMTSGHPSQAAKWLGEAVKMNRQSDITTQSNLWLGDARYALGEYAAAERAYNEYLSTAKKNKNRTLALYDLAYSVYMQDRYGEALSKFREALEARPALSGEMLDDARIRLADCRYYTGDYAGAKADYQKALDSGARDADYATYRMGVMQGLTGDLRGKIATLRSLEGKYPGSRWLSDALMEEGLTFEALGDTEKAAEAFSRVADDYPASEAARRAVLNMALSYMQAKDYAKATDAYKRVIRTWPSSREASMANDDLKKYYASVGELQSYATFLKSVPGAGQLDATELERLEFEGAETAFAENVKAVTLLEKYVENYPDGKYLSTALYDIAEAYKATGKYDKSVAAADMLISKRKFSPEYAAALLLKADVLENHTPGREEEALAAYKELEKSGGSEFVADALAGVMRMATDPREKLGYARKVKTLGGIGAEESAEAGYYEAEALTRLDRKDEAKEILGRLASNPQMEAGAKSAVALGEMQLADKDYKEAEETLVAFTDAGTPHQYWLARGFIALADTYKAQGKVYLAKEYLESLRDNYPGEEKDIREMITTRLKTWK